MCVLVRRSGLTFETVRLDRNTMPEQILLDLCEEFLALFLWQPLKVACSLSRDSGVTWVSEPLKLLQDV